MENNEVADCAQTFDEVKDELESIEQKLALRLQIPIKQCRLVLIARLHSGELEEDSLVADWCEVYQSYLSYTDNLENNKQKEKKMSKEKRESEPENDPFQDEPHEKHGFGD